MKLSISSIDESQKLRYLKDNLDFSPVRYYRSNSTVFTAGEPSRFLYIVDSGCLRVCRVTVDGRRQVCSFHFKGEVLGFDGSKLRQTYAEAIETSGVRALELTGPVVRSNLIMQLYSAHLEKMQEQTLNLVTRNAIERLAAFLGDIASRQMELDIVTLAMSRLDIAEHIGLTLETVSRSMHRLQEKKILEIISARKLKFFHPALSEFLKNSCN